MLWSFIQYFHQVKTSVCPILPNTHTLEIHPSIHPSIFYTVNPSVGSRGGWSLSQQSSGERRGTPWTGRQSITGPHRDKQPHTLTLTPKDNLETPINLTCMFLGGGRKPEYPERTHAYTGRTCKLHTERPQATLEMLMKNYFSWLELCYLFCADNLLKQNVKLYLLHISSLRVVQTHSDWILLLRCCRGLEFIPGLQKPPVQYRANTETVYHSFSQLI